MQHSLSSTILPGYRGRILSLLFLRPDESFHGREIARRTRLPAGTVTRELARLASVGLLEREPRGNQVLYKANRASSVFEEISGIVRKTAGLADVLTEALRGLADQIAIAFVFGSMARGEQNSGSDVDVLVIGTVEFGTVIDALAPAQKQLGREINPKVFTAGEWNAKRKANSAFTAEVLRNPKIFLVGDEHGLAIIGRRKS